MCKIACKMFLAFFICEAYVFSTDVRIITNAEITSIITLTLLLALVSFSFGGGILILSYLNLTTPYNAQY